MCVCVASRLIDWSLGSAAGRCGAVLFCCATATVPCAGARRRFTCAKSHIRFRRQRALHHVTAPSFSLSLSLSSSSLSPFLSSSAFFDRRIDQILPWWPFFEIKKERKKEGKMVYFAAYRQWRQKRWNLTQSHSIEFRLISCCCGMASDRYRIVWVSYQAITFYPMIRSHLTNFRIHLKPSRTSPMNIPRLRSSVIQFDL